MVKKLYVCYWKWSKDPSTSEKHASSKIFEVNSNHDDV